MVMQEMNVANQSVLESCTSSVIKLDEDNTISHISESLCQLLTLSSAQLVGQAATDCHPLVAQLLHADASIEIDNHGSRLQFQHELLEDPTSRGQTHIFTNITTVLDLHNENQRLKEEARQLQLIDPDTSLLTRRALLLILESQVARCRRYETPLSVIMLSLDETSDSNDMKQRLLKLSRLLKDQLRWSDLIARSADNQFTVILPETEQLAAHALVEKIREATSHWGDSFGIRYGLADWHKGLNASDLLMQCEHTLNEHADKQGNGQVVA